MNFMSSVRSDRIELNISKKHRNIEKIRFASIESDSVRYSRKVLEFHCTRFEILFALLRDITLLFLLLFVELLFCRIKFILTKDKL